MVMYISLTMKAARIYNEDRFRTPLAPERALGVWVDRTGWRQADKTKPSRFRLLGQYAAVAVEDGTGVLELVGGTHHKVEPGDVILLSPRIATRYYPRERWDTRWVVWNGPEANALARLSGLGSTVLVVRGGAPAVQTAWRRLDPLMNRQDFDAILDRKLALLDLIRQLSPHQKTETGNPRFLGAALRELTRDDHSPEPVTAVARRLHVSPAHFRRLFKSLTGSSPKAFQMAQRINRAKALLMEGRSIKETADTLEFKDVFHFMRQFRKITGQTAGQFAAAFSNKPGTDPVTSCPPKFQRRRTCHG